MVPLHLKPTEFTPEIIFDVDNQLFEIHGFSRPEDVRTFYQQFFNWVEENRTEIGEKIDSTSNLKVIFKLVYFNSASSKCLLDILIVLKKLYKENLDIDWYYEEGDEDLLEAGEEFSNAVEVIFNYIEIEEEL